MKERLQTAQKLNKDNDEMKANITEILSGLEGND